MARRPAPPSPGGDPDEDVGEAVLAANRAFYVAFTRRDYEAIETMWATNGAVVCVHPGQAPLLDRASILASWRAILGNPAAPRAEVGDEIVTISGRLAIVLCREILPGGHLMATNAYIRERDGWKMIHHHSAPVPPRRRAPASPPPKRDPRKLH